MSFPHERLDVYKKSIEFAAWVHGTLEGLPAKLAARDQLDRASTSIPLNIAEGNSKASSKDRCRFWQIALGSTYECVAILDVLQIRQFVEEERVRTGKSILQDIAAMLLALLKAFGTRVGEDQEDYIPKESDGGKE